MKRSRDPVKAGGFEGWTMADSSSEPSPSQTDDPRWATTAKSSRRGNERMRPKTREDGMMKNPTRRDLITGENPWNGAREAVGSAMVDSRSAISKCTTPEKPVIQPPGSACSGVTRWGQPTYRVLVWRAGEVEGSGKVSFHDLRSSAERILISAKRRFRVRGTHDLETRQHFFSVSGVSCMTSMMWSRISGGRYGFDIKVPVQNLKPPFLALEHHFDIYRLAYDQAVALFGESVREWIWMEVLEVGGH